MPRRPHDRHFGETSTSSITRMSNEAMMQTKLKNEHERWKFLKALRQLLSDEKSARLHTRRELELLKDEYTKMLACGSVYRDHCFGNYDHGWTRRPREGNTSLQGTSDLPHYLRLNTKDTERKPVKRSSSDVSDTVSKSLLARKRWSSLSESTLGASFSTTAVSEEDDNEVERHNNENRQNDQMEPVPEETHDPKTDKEEEKILGALSTVFAIKLHALIMWKQKIHKPQQRPESERPKFVRKKEIGETPPSDNLKLPALRPHSFLPGESKTVFGMKRFLEQEMENKITFLSSRRNKNGVQLNKLIERSRLPPLIQRQKTTSAIFRDFRTYKESLRSRRKERHEDNLDQSVPSLSPPIETDELVETEV